MATEPTPTTPTAGPRRHRRGGDLLVALADLQRHLDVLGEDLVAADRALTGWRGGARERFRDHLGHHLHALARVLDELRRAEVGVRDALDRDLDGTPPW